MPKNRLNTFQATLLALLLLTVNLGHAQGLPPLTHGLTAIAENNPAPDLRLQNLDEEVVDIKALTGKVVVVNFWATWCPPCRREMGSLERLYQQTKEKNVEILAVNIGEDFDTVFSFLGTVEPAPTFPMLLDLQGTSPKEWGVRGLPTTYVIDREGRLAYKAVGGREFDHMDIVNTVVQLATEK